jgi:hypothetical protein
MLELACADRRRVCTSLLWGAAGTPPKPDVDMAFIGDDAFTRDDRSRQAVPSAAL